MAPLIPDPTHTPYDLVPFLVPGFLLALGALSMVAGSFDAGLYAFTIGALALRMLWVPR